MSEEYISTSALAKLNNIVGKDLFEHLQASSMIERKDDKWVLCLIQVI